MFLEAVLASLVERCAGAHDVDEHCGALFAVAVRLFEIPDQCRSTRRKDNCCCLLEPGRT